MPHEDKNYDGSLVLDFRKRWRHVKTIYTSGSYSLAELQCDYSNQSHPTKFSTNLTNENRGGYE